MRINRFVTNINIRTNTFVERNGNYTHQKQMGYLATRKLMIGQEKVFTKVFATFSE